MTVYFSSDHHYFHHNVLKYCSRPFSTVEEMNEELIRRWNYVVKPKDTVYYLGDFSMAFRPVEIYSHRLNGIKKLVPGNHDFCHSFHKKSRNKENQAKWIAKYQEHGWEVLPEQTTLEIPGLANFNLCHLPYTEPPIKDATHGDKYNKYRLQNDGRWLLHGHCHEKVGKVDNMINVGVDVWDGYPCSLDQIALVMKDSRRYIEPPKWGKMLTNM